MEQRIPSGGEVDFRSLGKRDIFRGLDDDQRDHRALWRMAGLGCGRYDNRFRHCRLAAFHQYRAARHRTLC